jgi:hypothetical protein
VIACSIVPPGPCSPKAINTRADFVGTGKYSIGSGGREEDGNMVAYIIDHKEGSCNKGTRDEYFITVRKGLVDRSGRDRVRSRRLHRLRQPADPRDAGPPVRQRQRRQLGDGVAGVELLNRRTESVHGHDQLRLQGGGGRCASVDVGVYNVAVAS